MPQSIKYYGLSRFYQKNKIEIRKACDLAFEKGQFIDGEQTKSFENNLAVFCGRRYAVAVGSGTDALFFALKLMGINQDDEVLIPAISFIVSATAIIRAEAIPVFVDVNPQNALMDCNDAKTKITAKTKAILYVDLYGNLPEIEQIKSFAKTHNLIIIEDAAQALGSERNNIRAGNIGDISILSFDPSKPIGAFGTGGAVLTDDIDIANKCLQMRQNGKNPISKEYDSFGINSRMSEYQAVLLNMQLNNFEKTLNIRHNKAFLYKENIKNKNVSFVSGEQFNYKGNWHKFVISHPKRDELKKYLAENGVETMIHYANCLYEHEVLVSYKLGDCRNAEDLKNKVLSLPFYPELENEEIKIICNLINRFG